MTQPRRTRFQRRRDAALATPQGQAFVARLHRAAQEAMDDLAAGDPGKMDAMRSFVRDLIQAKRMACAHPQTEASKAKAAVSMRRFIRAKGKRRGPDGRFLS